MGKIQVNNNGTLVQAKKIQFNLDGLIKNAKKLQKNINGIITNLWMYMDLILVTGDNTNTMVRRDINTGDEIWSKYVSSYGVGVTGIEISSTNEIYISDSTNSGKSFKKFDKDGNLLNLGADQYMVPLCLTDTFIWCAKSSSLYKVSLDLQTIISNTEKSVGDILAYDTDLNNNLYIYHYRIDVTADAKLYYHYYISKISVLDCSLVFEKKLTSVRTTTSTNFDMFIINDCIYIVTQYTVDKYDLNGNMITNLFNRTSIIKNYNNTKFISYSGGEIKWHDLDGTVISSFITGDVIIKARVTDGDDNIFVTSGNNPYYLKCYTKDGVLKWSQQNTTSLKDIDISKNIGGK